MNESEALLNIIEAMAVTMLDYAMEDSPDEDSDELLDSFRDIAQSICDDLSLTITAINDGSISVVLSPR